MPTTKKTFGTYGEQLVARYLIHQGFTILEHNYQKSYGEIDLIATQGDVLAFVEVKTRMYHFIEPANLVPFSKQQKIIKTAYAFIAERNIVDKVYRFDIAFIQSTHNTEHIDYFPDAFTDQRS